MMVLIPAFGLREIFHQFVFLPATPGPSSFTSTNHIFYGIGVSDISPFFPLHLLCVYLELNPSETRVGASMMG